MSGSIHLNGHTFRVEQSMIEATSMVKPDVSRLFVDPHGHEHRWIDGKLPSLVVVSDGKYWCMECNDEHEESHYECLLCSSRVEPNMTSNNERQYVPGLRRIYVDNVSVTIEQFKAKWLEIGGDPTAVEKL